MLNLNKIPNIMEKEKMTEKERSRVILDHKLKMIDIKYAQKRNDMIMEYTNIVLRTNAQFDSLRMFMGLNTNITNEELLCLMKKE